jgi:FkbM family methyltransferase
MKTIKNYIPKNVILKYNDIKHNFFDGYATKSYSQEGEDRILKRVFEGKNNGFYVDVGAHHPKRFSNTYLFYQMGWRGINIEPNPDAISLFKKYRPGDINLQLGISDKDDQLIYYIFNDSALNTFSMQHAYMIESKSIFYIVDRKLVNVSCLSFILASHISYNKIIDFMNIDAEGLEINILKSNDWSRFRPHLLLVEELDFSFERSVIFQYLTEQGYIFLAKTLNTVFYQDNLLKIREEL